MSQQLELLRAKAEMLMRDSQPKLMEKLRQSGNLGKVLDDRASQALLVLQQCQEQKLDPCGTAELVNEALAPSPGEA